jgi:putative nucleotidyltransferase with HDIG domain
MACAVAAKVIGSHLRYEKIEELFVAGLLHDIGKIIEMLFMQDDFSAVEALVTEQNILMVRAEEQLLAYTHAEVGQLLAQRWNLPPKLANAIAYHHQPDVATDNNLEASIVHLADIFARALNVGSGGDKKMPVLNKFAWALLGIKREDIAALLEEVEKEFLDIDLSLIVELNE